MDKNTENLIDKKIDDLAIAMHKGFESIDNKFEEVGEKINSIKQDLEKNSQERHNELMNSNDKMIRIFENSQQINMKKDWITMERESKF